MMTAFIRLRSHRPLATILVTHTDDQARRLATRSLHLTGHPATLVASQP